MTQRAAQLLPRIQPLKAEHPCWGERRIWASLRFVAQVPVHKQQIWRLMREPHRLVQPNLRLTAKRTPMGSKPRATKPNAWWGSDMPKVMGAGVPCTAQQWLAALSMAVNPQVPAGARGQGWSLMSANGCQPTSLAFMEACSTLEIHQAFTRDNNPKGQADTERVRRPLKEEGLWRQEWTGPFALLSARTAWIDDYNTHYLHSALGYKPPRQFEREYYTSPSSPFVAA